MKFGFYLHDVGHECSFKRDLCFAMCLRLLGRVCEKFVNKFGTIFVRWELDTCHLHGGGGWLLVHNLEFFLY